MEDVEKLFNDEVREKKTTARGVHNRASRTGKISKVNLPSDFLGCEYTRSSKPVSFSVDEVLYILQETPTLKELLMQRLDTEYKNYSLAISRTIDAVARIQERALEAILNRVHDAEQQLKSLQKEMERLEKTLRESKHHVQEKQRAENQANRRRKSLETSTEKCGTTLLERNPVTFQPLTADQTGLTARVKVSRHQRQGEGRRPKSQEELKLKVFRRLDEILELEKDMRFKTVNSLFPGIKYYIYQLKIWESFDTLIQEYLSQREKDLNRVLLPTQ